MMPSRLTQFDRMYRQRLGLSLPTSVLLSLALLAVCAQQGLFPDPDRARIAQPGPLRILPQIDLAPVDDSRDTAAPNQPWASEFVVEEIEDFNVPELPVAEFTPDPAATALVDMFRPPEISEQTDYRTSGLPRLAQSEFQLVHFERPVYPRSAREAGREGLVEVLLRVRANGFVDRAEVVGGGRYPLLESAALVALRQAVFRPYRPEGEPIAFNVVVPVRFSLVD